MKQKKQHPKSITKQSKTTIDTSQHRSEVLRGLCLSEDRAGGLPLGNLVQKGRLHTGRIVDTRRNTFRQKSLQPFGWGGVVGRKNV